MRNIFIALLVIALVMLVRYMYMIQSTGWSWAANTGNYIGSAAMVFLALAMFISLRKQQRR